MAPGFGAPLRALRGMSVRVCPCLQSDAMGVDGVGQRVIDVEELVESH